MIFQKNGLLFVVLFVLYRGRQGVAVTDKSTSFWCSGVAYKKKLGEKIVDTNPCKDQRY